MKTRAVLFCAAALWGLSARAETVPAEVLAALPADMQVTLIGGTRLRIWGFDIYDARLWAAPGFKPSPYARQTFALELRYLRSFTSREIARRAIDEMRRSAKVGEAQSERWQEAMRAAFPDVKAGDRITGIYRPPGALGADASPASASFITNGQPTGEIRDGDFAALFFGIWLSPQTSEPAMRQALLAGAAP